MMGNWAALTMQKKLRTSAIYAVVGVTLMCSSCSNGTEPSGAPENIVVRTEDESVVEEPRSSDGEDPQPISKTDSVILSEIKEKLEGYWYYTEVYDIDHALKIEDGFLSGTFLNAVTPAEANLTEWFECARPEGVRVRLAYGPLDIDSEGRLLFPQKFVENQYLFFGDATEVVPEIDTLLVRSIHRRDVIELNKTEFIKQISEYQVESLLNIPDGGLYEGLRRDGNLIFFVGGGWVSYEQRVSPPPTVCHLVRASD